MAVAVGFDGDDIHGVEEGLVLVLCVVEIGCHGEAVDEDAGWFGGVVRTRHLIADLSSPKMRDFDYLGVRHDAVGPFSSRCG